MRQPPAKENRRPPRERSHFSQAAAKSASLDFGVQVFAPLPRQLPAERTEVSASDDQVSVSSPTDGTRAVASVQDFGRPHILKASPVVVGAPASPHVALQPRCAVQAEDPSGPVGPLRLQLPELGTDEAGSPVVSGRLRVLQPNERGQPADRDTKDTAAHTAVSPSAEAAESPASGQEGSAEPPGLHAERGCRRRQRLRAA